MERDVLFKTEKEYESMVASGMLLVGRIATDYTPIFERDEVVEIIPDFEEGETTGFVTAQTRGTWCPNEVDHICVDDIIEANIVKTWK